MIISHQSAVWFWRAFRTQLLPRVGLGRWLEDEERAVQLLHSGKCWSSSYREYIRRMDRPDALLAALTLDNGSNMQIPENIGLIDSHAERCVLDEHLAPKQDIERAIKQHPLAASIPAPVHLLVNSTSKRRKINLVSCHVTTQPLPEGSIYRIAPELYVCSPELTFVQMAESLSRPKLVRLGSELCGGYAIAPWTERGFSNCYSVTSPTLIDRTISQAKWIRGRKAASIALRRVLPRCASPAETDAAIILSFPRTEGGSGLKAPSINMWVPNENGFLNSGGEKGYWCDMVYAKEHAIIGCDGREGHSDDGSRIADATKHRNLTADGYKVLVIVNSQIRDRNAMTAIASNIARLIGARQKTAPKDFCHKQSLLYRELFG